MPRSNHSRKGVSRKRKGNSQPKIRCRFCKQLKSAGHKAGCIGSIASNFTAGIATGLDGWK